VPKITRIGSEWSLSERQLDWIECDDFLPCPTDVAGPDKYRANIKTQRVAYCNL
jgi:hypothetical protein